MKSVASNSENSSVNLTAERCSISAEEQRGGLQDELWKDSRDGGLVPEVKRLLEQPPWRAAVRDVDAGERER
jgi:hypothetical protein